MRHGAYSKPTMCETDMLKKANRYGYLDANIVRNTQEFCGLMQKRRRLQACCQVEVIRDEQECKEAQSSYGSFSRREKQKCPSYSSSNGMKTEKRPAGEEITAQAKRSAQPNLGLKKAKKRLKRMKIEVAERRGETTLMMELLKNEKKETEIAVGKIQNDIERMKRENLLKLEKDECTRQFVNHMLVIFEAEDNLMVD